MQRARSATAVGLGAAASGAGRGRAGVTPVAWLVGALAIQADLGRASLWLAVAFAGGILLHAAAPETPALWAGPLVAALALGLAWIARGRFAALAVASMAAATALGFTAASLAEWRAARHPVLSRTMTAEAVGVVTAIEPRQKDRRLYLRLVSLGTLADGDRPDLARVIAPTAPALRPGDGIRFTATFRPPPGPVLPGGYDPAREAFAQGIGAFGTGAEAIRPAAVDLTGWERLSTRVERLRLALTERIVAGIGGTAGAIAAALVTGIRTQIPPDADAAMRAAGLSHVLSISGMHLALVAGVLFAGSRALLALVPGLALRWPIKTWAALVALAGAAFYLLLSGGNVATQRSFLMTAIVLLAVAAGRPALTMRNVAIAAVAVLAVSPGSLLGPSFQMSFAAVIAIVAGFESPRIGAFLSGAAGQGLTGRTARLLLATLATTLLAGLATAPFAAYHFHRVTPYALLGNMLALPLVSLWIMPAAVLAALLVPFGFDGLAWRLMGHGIDAMLAVAHWVAALPGAERPIPAFGPEILVLLTAGLLLACLPGGALRLTALPLIAAGLLLAPLADRPDVYVDPSGRAMAVRGGDGRLSVAGARFASLAARAWLEADGDDVRRRYRPGPGTGCDATGCIATLADGRLVALVYDPGAFEEDCRRAALVVTRLTAPPGCDRAAAVVDRSVLAITGALAFRIDGDGFRYAAARPPDSSRPWYGRSSAADAAARSLPARFAPRRPSPPAAEDGPEEADPETLPSLDAGTDDDQ